MFYCCISRPLGISCPNVTCPTHSNSIPLDHFVLLVSPKYFPHLLGNHQAAPPGDQKRSHTNLPPCLSNFLPPASHTCDSALQAFLSSCTSLLNIINFHKHRGGQVSNPSRTPKPLPYSSSSSSSIPGINTNRGSPITIVALGFVTLKNYPGPLSGLYLKCLCSVRAPFTVQQILIPGFGRHFASENRWFTFDKAANDSSYPSINARALANGIFSLASICFARSSKVREYPAAALL